MLRWLIHALDAHVELCRNVPGLALEFVEEPPLLLLDRALAEEHALEPRGLLGDDPAINEDVVTDRPEEEVLEARVGVLHPAIQIDQEVGLGPAGPPAHIQR